jgi:hypothetical protein
MQKQEPSFRKNREVDLGASVPEIVSEPDNRGGIDRAEIEGHLSTIEKYLAYASLFYDSFEIRENRGVFWWSLHKLLDSSGTSAIPSFFRGPKHN